MLLKAITGIRSFLRLALLMGGLLGSVFFLLQQPASAEPEAPTEAWIEPIHVSVDSTYGAFAPVVQIAPNGKLMVMYNHERTSALNPPYTPYYSRSVNGGKTWASGSVYSGSESAAQVGFAFDSASQAHAVWRTNSGLYYAGENEWPVATGHQIVASGGRRIDNPAIAVQDDTIFVVWLHANSNNVKNVFYRYSRDGGQSWKPALPLPALTTVDDANASAAPDVVFDANGDVHIVWEESTSAFPNPGFRYEIYHRKGTRSGTAGSYQWGPVRILSDSHPQDPSRDTSDSSYQPSIVQDGNSLHVVFEERQDVEGGNSDQANAQISPYHVAYLPGSGWQAPQRIIGNHVFYVNTRLPFYLGTSLAACDGNLSVFFHGAELVNSSELVWGVSQRNGSWSYPEAVTSPASRHTNPSVACKGGIVSLSFEEIVSSVTNHQIYYSENTASGIFLPIIFH